ncbi:hypothetical protein [uncultured Methylobacterium sp.]|jgi:hypothetical protein|nr:hypothetical protein [uncultured Methylobacterium sp.]
MAKLSLTLGLAAAILALVVARRTLAEGARQIRHGGQAKPG